MDGVAHMLEAQRVAQTPRSSSSKNWNSDEVPAPTQFVRRQRGKAGPIDTSRSKISPQHTPYGIGENISPSQGMHSIYYYAHREYVAKVLNSSDAIASQGRRAEHWDEDFLSLA